MFFYKQHQAEIGKGSSKAKQHPKAKLLLFEIYTLSSFMLSSKANMRYSKKCAKSKCVCFNEIV